MTGGASALFIMDAKGKVLISRDYRGDISLSAATECFQQRVVEAEEPLLVTPVFLWEGVSFVWIQHSNIYLLAVARGNVNAALLLVFLYRVRSVLREYFKALEEESIRDNFVVTYELLDELADGGYPQSTEVKVLREFIKNEAYQLSVDAVRPPVAMTNAVSWRSEGIFHKKNEIFLDVVEKLNLLVSPTGAVARSEILGSLRMKSFLSGMPELKLGLNDKMLLQQQSARTAAASRGAGGGGASAPGGLFPGPGGGGASGAGGAAAAAASSFSRGAAAGGGKSTGVEMEDIRFHQCVRLARFETDRTISFIPPDGEFELMSYRLNTQVKPLIWVEAHVAKDPYRGYELQVRARSQYKSRSVASVVEIHVPVPPDVTRPAFRTPSGSVKYHPENDTVVWTLKQLQGQRDLLLTASFNLPTLGEPTARDAYRRRPINVRFEIPYFTVSGLTVRYLKIIEKSGYQALPWVRYITQNGEYQLPLS